MHLQNLETKLIQDYKNKLISIFTKSQTTKNIFNLKKKYN